MLANHSITDHHYRHKEARDRVQLCETSSQISQAAQRVEKSSGFERAGLVVRREDTKITALGEQR